jgi:predicted ATPase/DNA-binding SARP family transcriptional activator/Tfp pilus assembly protein PilF
MGKLLRIQTLGGFYIELDGELVTGLASRKAEALLVYLACTRKAHAREILATLLWDDRPHTRALGNLSVLLTSLRKHLEPYISITRQAVAFKLESNHWLDVAEMETGLGKWKKAKDAGRATSSEDFNEFRATLDLCGGEFLEGFYIRDSRGFEEWALLERERLRWLVIEAFGEVVTHHLARGESEEGIRQSRRLQLLDPIREGTHRTLMLLLARSGQRSAALAQYQSCRSILENELGVEPSRETTRLYERIQVVSLRPQHNLPVQRTPFVGRLNELAEIRARLANPNCRLLTILGPGGIGKTRLALQAGKALVEAYLNGVFLISLAPVTEPDSIVATIAQALDVQFQGIGGESEQLLDYLREKEMLLILDNFEQLLPSVDVLIEILQQAPDVKLMVTTRERLNLREEWLYDVQGLSYPVTAEDVWGKTEFELDRVEKYEAGQLFLQHARRVKSGFKLEGEDHTCVFQICQLVEGMPLGIELASAWVRVLPCREIARQIKGNLDLLATSTRNIPDRHRNMMAVFDHSWGLLQEDERRIFMKLSTFRGGFQLEAAEQVAGATLDVLSGLIDKSLLRVTSPNYGEDNLRYEIHELIRQYASDQLARDANTKKKTQGSHCIYFAQFLHQKESVLKGRGQKEAIEEISEEIENVRLAWRHAVEHKEIDKIQQSLASLFRFYLVRSWYREGEEAFGQAVDTFVGIEGKETFDNQEKKHTLGMLLARQGAFCGQLAQYDKAIGLIQESLSIHRALGSLVEIAFSLSGLGNVFRMIGNYEQAIESFDEGLSLYKKIDDRLGIADVLNNFALINYRLSDYKDARNNIQESLRIRRELNDQQGTARCLLNLGTVAYRLGEYEKANQLNSESLALCKAIGDRWGIAACLNNQGNIAERLGNNQQAQDLYSQSLMIKREIGQRASIATSLYNLGKVAHQLGESRKAIQLYNESLTILKNIGDQWSISNALSGLGIVQLGAGFYAEATKNMLESLKIAREIGSTVLVEAALVGMAEIIAIKGEKERAIELLSMILERPPREQEVQDKAESLIIKFGPCLPSEAFDGVYNRGKEMDLEQVVRELMAGIL